MNKMKAEDLIATMQKAADSVLAGDRARAGGPDQKTGAIRYGDGQHLTDVERVDVGVHPDADDVAVVQLHGFKGENAIAPILPHALHLPTGREVRPGDVHDAVRGAMLTASAQLADGRA